MTFPKTYKPYKATHGTNVITGLVSIDDGISANAVSQRADGAVTTTRVYTEGHKGTVTVRAETNEAIKLLKVGDAATLVGLYYEQIEGAASGTLTAARTKQWPASAAVTVGGHAVITAISDGAPHNGQPTVNVTFEVASPTGVVADLVSYTDV